MKCEDQVVSQNYTQVISHTHLQLHIYFNCFFLELVWLAQKCRKQAPPSNLILWGAFDTVGRRDGSSLRARSLVGTENASRREEWDEEKSLFLDPFFSPSLLTSEPSRRLGWLHRCNPKLDSRSSCHGMA